MRLGEKIRELRLARGLRQLDLANSLQVQSSLISGLETGARTHVSERMLSRIATALDLSDDDFNDLRALKKGKQIPPGNLIEIPDCATDAELHTIRLLAGCVGSMPSLQFLALGQYLEQWQRIQNGKRSTPSG